jgi:rod shape-determining protein MreD
VIVTAGTVVRVGLLLLVAVVTQISGFSGIRIFGGGFDLIPLVVAAIALYGGSVTGSVVGFACGMLADLALGHNLGASSLVLTAVGYGVGRFGEERDPAHGLIAIPVGGAATFAYVFALGAVNFMLEIDARVSGLVLRDALITVLLNAWLALLVFGIVKRLLRPVLASEPGHRRRPAETRPTGPLGLRGLEV